METVTEIILLVKYSPKRKNLLGNIKDLVHFESLHTDDEIEVAPTLDKLSAATSTVSENAYKVIVKMFQICLSTYSLYTQLNVH